MARRNEYSEKLMLNHCFTKTNPLGAMADRNYLIADHMKFLQSLRELGPLEFGINITAAVNAPNASFPIITLSKENVISIQDILKAGPDYAHKGKVLLCRSILPSGRQISLNILVEDPAGERALRVGLYNFSRDVYPGTILAIMHPWFKTAADFGFWIRVENPMHVQILKGAEAILRDVVWKVPLPTESGVQEKKPDDDPAMEGNTYFVQQDYPKAVEAYSKAIEKRPNAILYSNRALTYLKMEKPASALKDTEDGLKLDQSNIKLLYRKGKSLLFLKRYDEAAAFMEQASLQFREASKNKAFMETLSDAKRMRDEAKTGNYDLLTMIEEAKKSKLLENHADYCAPHMFKLKKIKGKGRGFVAIRKIEAGTLLMACKAFAFVHASEGVFALSVSTFAVETFSFASMVKKICEKLSKNPDLADDFYKLYAGKELGHLEKVDQSNLVDVGRISGIVRLNTYAAEDKFNPKNMESEFAKDVALWLLPSYFNHSCVDCNCFRYVVGDILFIRAKKAIKPGEELLLEYIHPSQPYLRRSQTLCGLLGFECSCRLCQADRSESNEVHKRYDEITDILDKMRQRFDGKRDFEPGDIALLKALLKELLEYRPEKDINFLAMRVQKALSAAIFLTLPTYSVHLLQELVAINESVGDLYTALIFAKLLVTASAFKGEDEMAKWINATKKLAKTLFGDKRAAEQLSLCG